MSELENGNPIRVSASISEFLRHVFSCKVKMQSTSAPILLTSFAPWRASQPSNSSDDLLIQSQRTGVLPPEAVILHKLPVNFQLAPTQVIAKIFELRPRYVVCCGMAESRNQLNLELQGTCNQRVLKTSINLKRLMMGAQITEVSHSAGDFVCNHLYFKVLDFLNHANWPCECVFVHVPRLTKANWQPIQSDFQLMLDRLSTAQKPLWVKQAA